MALLLVLGLILLLYMGPATSFVRTYQTATHKRAEVRHLLAENKTLEARRRALENPSTLEGAARRMGMVRSGERAFIVPGASG